MSDNSLFDRIKSEQSCMHPITVADLVCKDCVYRYDDAEIPGNVSRCDMYKDVYKPVEIIKGGPCRFYKKQ
jgi:hypothetical protein